MLLKDIANPDAIIVSDIHIRDKDDLKHEVLLKLIADAKLCKPKYMFLLGDIFDFCLGKSAYFHEKFERIGKALSELAGHGTKVIFFEGNHEFDASFLPWSGVEFIFEGDHIFELDSGVRILLAHGDLVYSHRMYKAFRGVVKTRLVKSVASALPGKWMDQFALGNAHVSRAADEYRSLDHEDVQNTMQKWADQYECDHAFFGHLHYPYGFRRGSGGWIASCGSWDAPTMLMIKGKELFRSEFSLEDPIFQFESLKTNEGKKHREQSA